MEFETVGSPLAWGGFILLVLAMLALDLGVFHRRPHSVTFKEAAIWSVVWVALSAAFGVLVHFWFGPERALEFATGYVIEKALAVDNIFVFVVIFSTFAVPAVHQHRVLFWGVLGALVMRAVFILLGGALLQRFHFTLYVFGAILLITGIKLVVQRDGHAHPENNPVVKAFQRFLPVLPDATSGGFIVVRDGRRFATPLLVALVAVEVADLVFAIDSIPAVFAVTSDPFIVFTSNILAILGLRSMYFLLAGAVTKFTYLKLGLSGVLVFVGAKMLLVDLVEIPIVLSLVVIALILGAAIVASAIRRRSEPQGSWPSTGGG